MDQIQETLNQIMQKLDKYTDEMPVKIKTIDGWTCVGEFINKYSAKYGFNYTVKPGQLYPSTIRNPRNTRERIASLEGSYLLTNDPKNVKYSSEDYDEFEGDTNNGVKYTRELVVVEAKNYLKREYIMAQADKMKKLIDYFADVNLYYQAKKDDNLELVRKVEQWTANFVDLCEKYNMNFSGILLLFGAPSGIKSIHHEFRAMKELFKDMLVDDITSLSERIDLLNNDQYLTYKLKHELVFKLNYKFDFELLIPSGYSGREDTDNVA